MEEFGEIFHFLLTEDLEAHNAAVKKQLEGRLTGHASRWTGEFGARPSRKYCISKRQAIG